ncbi:MAG: 30S ribosomal protein S3 [Spirochaetia bacterium]|nr:30S ribosomal protein S3 [Spirochaetia bacterium]
MGQKVNPIGLRLGITRSWDSVWYANEDYTKNLHEDLAIRRTLGKRFKRAGIVKTIIERFPEKINVNIYTVRPGVIIGQKGASIEAAKAELKKFVVKPLSLSIVEVKKPETVAQVIADTIGQQLEQRMPFRRVMKQALRGAMRGGVEGVKIMVSGRLNGADMSRTEQYKDGRVPLHTLRAKIEYAFSEAMTTYGKIGVKVWTYHGDYLPGQDKVEEETLPRRQGRGNRD